MTEAGEIDGFDFPSWAADRGLKRKTTDALSKQDFSTKEVLLLMTSTDLAALDITAGQARLLWRALAELGNPAFHAAERGESRADPSPRRPGDDVQADDEEPAGMLPLPVAGTSAQHQDILKAGEMLDRILNDPTSDLTSRAHLEGDRLVCTTLVDDTTPRPTWDSFDPHVLLTVRATSKKALQPKDFVPEQVKQRIARRRRETLKWVEADDGSFSVQADDQVLAYLTQAEWGAANMRLMAHLLKVGDLQRARVEDYMAYTVSIYELACHYEWIAVLEYDARYREQQAEHGGAPQHVTWSLFSSYPGDVTTSHPRCHRDVPDTGREQVEVLQQADPWACMASSRSWIPLPHLWSHVSCS